MLFKHEQYRKINPEYTYHIYKTTKRHTVEFYIGSSTWDWENNPYSKSVRHIESQKEFVSATEAGEIFNTSNSTISRHCNNKVKTPKFEFMK